MKKFLLIASAMLLQAVILCAQQPSNPRSPAEWEEVQAVVMEADIFRSHPSVSWEEAIDPYLKIAQACIHENVRFYCVTYDTLKLLGVRTPFLIDTIFSNRGIVSPLITILKAPQDMDVYGPWTRDHGLFAFYENETGPLTLADFGAQENVQSLITTTMGLPSLNIACSHTGSSLQGYYDGGNWLSDGHHTFNIANVHPGVPIGLQQPALADFKDYMGINKTLNVKGVGVHTDYWLKMIDEERAIVSFIPPSNYGPEDSYLNHQDDINAGKQQIMQHLTSAFGRTIKFYEIQNAPTYNSAATNTTYLTSDASYTNSLILNKTVLVPQYGVQPYDQQALDKYTALMPGYTVTGVLCTQYVQGGGAVHCTTHEIPANDPLYIKHAWLKDTIEAASQYPVTATVKSHRGIAGVKLFWKTETGTTWTEVTMTGTGTEYAAVIPGQPAGTTLHYYLSASDNQGKTISKPMVAPLGFYKSFIKTATVGIDKKESEKEAIALYPNPAKDILHLKFINGKPAGAGLQVYDNSGRLVLDLPAKASMQINIQGFSQGMYYLRCGSLVRKFAVQH